MIRKRTVELAVALAGATFLLVAPAKANTYDGTFDGKNFDAFFSFSTDASNNVLSFSGNIIGLTPLTAGESGSITSLINGPTNPFYAPSGNGWTFTNTYDPSTGIFPDQGLLVAFGAGNFANFYTDGVNEFLSVDSPSALFNPGDAGKLSVSQTPLPPAWTMMLIGFAGLGCVLYRRTRQEGVGEMIPA
jgi:hypothetical protein